MRYSTITLLAFLAGLMAACGTNPSDAARLATKARLNPVYNAESGRLERLTYDSNGDGRTNIWAYMDGARVVRIETDENADGRADRFEYYDANQPLGHSPVVSRVEEATNYDGRINRWEFYDAGVLQRVEVDADGDGRVDKWERYDKGVLLSVGVDLEHRGLPTRRLMYRADGSFDHVEKTDELPASP